MGVDGLAAAPGYRVLGTMGGGGSQASGEKNKAVLVVGCRGSRGAEAVG